MQLLGSTKGKITKDKNGENVPRLEITEVILVQYNIVNDDYQQYSRALCGFFLSKPFGQLLETSPTNFIFLKAINSEFQVIEVWFTDQNSKPFETGNKINIALAINLSVKNKNDVIPNST